MACTQTTRIIAAGSSAVAYSVNASEISSVLGAMTVTDTVATAIKASLIHLSYTGSPPSPLYVEYGIIGAVIPYTLSIAYDAGTGKIDLTFTNDHSNEVRVDFAEIGKA